MAEVRFRDVAVQRLVPGEASPTKVVVGGIQAQIVGEGRYATPADLHSYAAVESHADCWAVAAASHYGLAGLADQHRALLHILAAVVEHVARGTLFPVHLADGMAWTLQVVHEGGCAAPNLDSQDEILLGPHA